MALSKLPASTPAILRAAGLQVVEVPNWQTRGHSLTAAKFSGAMAHHTGSFDGGGDAANDLAYSNWLAKVGRPDLKAPLCNFALSAEGVVYIVAAGVAYHAGTAKPSGTMAGGNGNLLYLGIEAMNSGSQGWSTKQMAAYVTLCAVICNDLTGNSAETVRGHKETSKTGKWDPGLMDMNKFRKDVKARMTTLKAVKKPNDSVQLKGIHYSGLFKNSASKYNKLGKVVSDGQWYKDLIKVMNKNPAWITGTEAGENPNWKDIKRAAAVRGYVVRRIRSNWVGVKRSLIKKGSFSWGHEIVAKSKQVATPGHDLSIIWATFTHVTPGVGKISVLGTHYPIKGDPGRKSKEYLINLKWTKKLAERLGHHARRLGKGKALCFAGLDTNILGNLSDPFFGNPFVTCWTDRKKYPGTGHGNIDVIARFKGDARVKCVSTRVFRDAQMHLYSDHFLVQAVYEISLTK